VENAGKQDVSEVLKMLKTPMVKSNDILVIKLVKAPKKRVKIICFGQC